MVNENKSSNCVTVSFPYCTDDQILKKLAKENGPKVKTDPAAQ